MVKRQIALTKARATLSQMARKGGIRPGELVEVTRRGQVVLVVQRPEDFAQRVSRLSKTARPGKLWGTAVILGDLEEASRVAEARVRSSLGRPAK